MAVYDLILSGTRKGSQALAKTATGTITSADVFRLNMGADRAHQFVTLRHLRVAVSGGAATRVDPAAYLDDAQTAALKVWSGSWSGIAGLIFAAGDAEQIIPLDGDGCAFFAPGLDGNVTSATVAVIVGLD